MSSPLLKTSYGDRLTMGNRILSSDSIVTRDKVVNATLILITLCAGSALATVGVGLYVSLAAASMLNLVGCGGVIILTLALLFSPSLRQKARGTGIAMALFQGLMLGGFTFSIGSYTYKGVEGWTLVMQALMGTIGLFFVALFLYKTGAIRVTSGFTKFIVFASAGFGLLYLINFGVALVTKHNFLMGNGPIPIIIGIAAIILATLTLIQDFDSVDKMVEAGSPETFTWMLATSILSSLVWLYMELLRVLMLFARR